MIKSEVSVQALQVQDFGLSYHNQNMGEQGKFN